MKARRIYKVHCDSTQSFVKTMEELGFRYDFTGVLVNLISGYNYWYETAESFGAISEATAKKLQKEQDVELINW